jgi:iron complex transport system ATP-binding protein
MNDLLQAVGLQVAVPGRVLVDALDCTLRAGELIALLGGNGSGKSLLLRTLAGLRAPGAGRVLLAGVDIG